MPSKNLDSSKIPSTLKVFLEHYPEINRIVLHLDNDNAGIKASKAIIKSLSNQYKVINNPPLIGKDYNDFLLYYRNKYNER